ncbi:MAG: aminoglycoside phosphotransferase family protein [Clostridia bacterium]|nr:aminoglycoside phosphotransferase family protein [Clostridia bacterium]MDE7328904.1 aminoglycoside phosphotransferase family protein [Clostridia bacterium]
MNAIEITQFFNFGGKAVSATPHGNGHINDTYLITLEKSDNKFILQRLNTKVFKNYVGLMDNILKVTSSLREIIVNEGGDAKRECMTLVPTLDGKTYYMDGEDCWRAYIFVENTEVYQVISSPTIFQNTGEAFGKFIARLDGFDASTLVEVIPNFHNTVDRYRKFSASLEADKMKRAKNAEQEIAFVKAHKDMLSAIVDALDKKQIPLRVTHNDTKINNVLIDKASGKAICVIDLDTIMPGSLLYDFGDSIRSGCNTAEEDERDLSKVDFNVSLYEAFCKGFLKGIGDKITQKEIDMLHLGAIIITLECGIRFLTDYLDGDEYFKTKYAEHNLVRCRTQFKLVGIMEQMSDKLLEIARNCKL